MNEIRKEYKGFNIHCYCEGYYDWCHEVDFEIGCKSGFLSLEDGLNYAEKYIDCYLSEGKKINGYILKKQGEFYFLFRNDKFLGDFTIKDESFLEQGISYNGYNLRGNGDTIVVLDEKMTEDEVANCLPLSFEIDLNIIKGQTREKAIENAKLYIDELSNALIIDDFKIFTIPTFSYCVNGVEGVMWNLMINDKDNKPYMRKPMLESKKIAINWAVDYLARRKS